MTHLGVLFDNFESHPRVSSAWAALTAAFQVHYSNGCSETDIVQRVNTTVQWLIEYAGTFESWKDKPLKWNDMYFIHGLCECAVWTGYNEQFSIIDHIQDAYHDLKSFELEFNMFNDFMGHPDNDWDVLHAMQDRHFQRGCIVSDMTDYRS